MLKRLVLPIAICLLTFVQGVSAQTETPTAESFPTFPVEQRCISAPTAPPKGWTYPGMILMSGYAAANVIEASVAANEFQFLQKPFDMDDLARTLRAVLHPMGAVGRPQS